VKNKIHTPEAMEEFETCLNDAQPQTEMDGMLEMFCKNLYRGKPEAFMNCIKNRNSECLVLWSESKTIVRFFHLFKFIYIHYNKDTRRYKVMKHREIDDPNYQRPQHNHNYRDNRNSYHDNRSYSDNTEEYPSLPGASSSSSSSTSNAPSFRSKLVSSLLDEVVVPEENNVDPQSIIVRHD
jgi:hypothetical protein